MVFHGYHLNYIKFLLSWKAVGAPGGAGAWAVLRTLRVVGAVTRPSGRSAPGPRLPGGGPHFSREMGRKRAGAAPLDPGFYGPLTLVRSFWGSFSLIRSRGYSLRYAKADLGRIFEGKYVGKHVCERRFPNRAHLPQSLPLGGRTVRGTVRSGPGEATINHRCPSAHTGANEGAIWYPTFPCRKSERLSPVAPTEFFSCPVGQPDRPLISHLR